MSWKTRRDNGKRFQGRSKSPDRTVITRLSNQDAHRESQEVVWAKVEALITAKADLMLDLIRASNDAKTEYGFLIYADGTLGKISEGGENLINLIRDEKKKVLGSFHTHPIAPWEDSKEGLLAAHEDARNFSDGDLDHFKKSREKFICIGFSDAESHARVKSRVKGSGHEADIVVGTV